MKAEMMLAAALGAAVLSGCGSTEDAGYGTFDASVSDNWLETKAWEKFMKPGATDGFDSRRLFFSLFAMKQCYILDGTTPECRKAKGEARGMLSALDTKCFYGNGKACMMLGDMIDDFYDDDPSKIDSFVLYKKAKGLPPNERIIDWAGAEKEFNSFHAWLDLPSARLVGQYFRHLAGNEKMTPVPRLLAESSKKACYAKEPDPSACARYAPTYPPAVAIGQLERGYKMGDPLAALKLFQIYAGAGFADMGGVKGDIGFEGFEDDAKSWFYLNETCRLSGTPELCNGITKENVWTARKHKGDVFKWAYPVYGDDEKSYSRNKKPWLTKQADGVMLHVPYQFYAIACYLNVPATGCR